MDRAQGLPKAGDIVGAKYRIEAQIGAGGMGVVFEAVHLETEARVAVKWLSAELSAIPSAVQRLKVEARATGRIRHPNVVAIHDLGECGGGVYLVMELLRGVTLRARLAQGRCELGEALGILLPVMRGVSAAHAADVLHRDLKPDNIFLAQYADVREPVPKVLDFGIAKLGSNPVGTRQTTAHTGILGTYPYMAFEQLHGRSDLDARVDVYALGAILYNMLTCRLPYEADNPVDLALRMLQSRPVPMTTYAPSLPAALLPVVEGALACDRDQRYPSVDAFARALEPFSTFAVSVSTGPLRHGQRASHITEEAVNVPALPTPFLASRPAPAARASKHSRRQRIMRGLFTLAFVVCSVAAALSYENLTRPSRRANMTPAGQKMRQLEPVLSRPVAAAPKPKSETRPEPPVAHTDWETSPQLAPALTAEKHEADGGIETKDAVDEARDHEKHASKLEQSVGAASQPQPQRRGSAVRLMDGMDELLRPDGKTTSSDRARK